MRGDGNMAVFQTSDERRKVLGQITEALREAGYTSLDAQAKALGLPRSTAYTIIKCQHKVGRLSKGVLEKMLAHPELPKSVRVVLDEYRVPKLESRNARRPNKQRRSQRA
jgi:hypothetical protein